MKKFLVSLAALALFLGLAACSSNDESKTEEKDTKKTEEAAAPKNDVKKDLVKFYNGLAEKINAKDGDLNAYEAKAAKKDPKPEDLPTAEDRAKASESAAAVAAELNSTQIPVELKDHQADLEAAVKEYAAAYQAKADELKKDAPNFEAAEATYTKAEEALGKVYEAEKMFPPSLGNQVN
ncbi:hypothetical protein [Neobacillus niacini]|uniref:hypothetical protein n=1 Tax=Neobacillus niacini TaxID=86668 RepID=UPI0021CB0B85|nr:hypothetical protein [Neobacillus niacini]MCM3767322.1 hypothetical protein [Neobacillus niacini]